MSLRTRHSIPTFIIPAIVGGYGIFSLIALNWINDLDQSNTLRIHESELMVQKNEIRTLGRHLVSLSEQEENLSDDLANKIKEINKLDNRIDNYRDDIDELEKIVETDPELLQKYSKVYFLNEHYTPERLKKIESKWVDATKQNLQIHKKVWPFLEDLLEDAERDDINLRIISAFRSFEYQSELKGQYLTSYGSAANTFSADQGYSEHQLGTTVDFNTPEMAGRLDGFQTTEAYVWLLNNAHKHGFVLSYDEHNSYYIFEPWHWRFVGEDLADDLRDDGETFYERDQRKLDEYLGEIFE